MITCLKLYNPSLPAILKLRFSRCLEGMFLGSSHTSSPGVWKPKGILEKKTENCCKGRLSAFVGVAKGVF